MSKVQRARKIKTEARAVLAALDMPAFRLCVKHDGEPSNLPVVVHSEEEYQRDGPIWTTAPDKGGRPLTWEEYQRSYGDVSNYAVCGFIAEVQCKCCGGWSQIDALWGIVFYGGSRIEGMMRDWSPDYETHDIAEIEHWPSSYAKDTARDVLASARHEYLARVRAGKEHDH